MEPSQDLDGLAILKRANLKVPATGPITTWTVRCIEEVPLRPLDFGIDHEILPGVTIRFRLAGHILGAASVEIRHARLRTVFLGDLGRLDSPTTPDPETVLAAGHLMVEWTYGNRRHEDRSAEDAIAEVARRTSARGATVLVPPLGLRGGRARRAGTARMTAASTLKVGRTGVIDCLRSVLPVPLIPDGRIIPAIAHARRSARKPGSAHHYVTNYVPALIGNGARPVVGRRMNAATARRRGGVSPIMASLAVHGYARCERKGAPSPKSLRCTFGEKLPRRASSSRRHFTRPKGEY